MKSGNWIALDKNLCHFLPHGRSYTVLEAMYSYTLDIDNNREQSINGYSKQWTWSRCKVRRFMTDLKTGTRHLTDRDKTGKRQRISLKINNLQEPKDRGKTGARQSLDRGLDTTIKPNPKPKPKSKHLWILPEGIKPEVWQEYEDHRKTTKVKLTDEARTLNTNVLLSNLSDQQEIVDASIKSGWTGLFPLKKKSGGKQDGKYTGLSNKDYSEGIEGFSEDM